MVEKTSFFTFGIDRNTPTILYQHPQGAYYMLICHNLPQGLVTGVIQTFWYVQ
jgi:hypothetical protein